MKPGVFHHPAERGHVTLPENAWIWRFSFFVMLVTTVPYLLGFALQGNEYQFTGFVFAIEDGNSYIAKMLSGTSGAWLFKTPYTAYPQMGILMFIPYILLGKLASCPGSHEQLVALYHLFRVVAGMLAFKATYDFIAYFLSDIKYRRMGLVLVTLGGGLGWIMALIGKPYLFGSLPLEFYSPETFGFLGLFGIPHLSVARALLLWTLLAYLKQVDRSGEARSPILSVLTISGLWLTAGLMQPLATLLIGALIVTHLSFLNLWLFLKKDGQSIGGVDCVRLAKLVVLAGIVPGIFTIYQVWSVYRDPFLAKWTEQNIILSPHPVHYLLAYGIILPFAFLGGRKLLSSNRLAGSLLVGWALALPFLAYAPVNLQRRLPEGGWVVLVLLAMIGLEQADAERALKGKRRMLAYGPLLFLFPSTIFLFAGGVLNSLQLAVPLYRPMDEVQAFKYLADQAETGSVVLSSFETGNVLPAWAPLRVVIGHGPESVNLAEIRPEVDAIFSEDTTDEVRLELLSKFNVKYIFYGPNEQALGGWTPDDETFLIQSFRSGNYSIYQVLWQPND